MPNPDNPPMPVLLSGPSGSGKSRLGAYLSSQRWLHLEADERDRDGLDAFGLRAAWNTFWNATDPAPLAEELERRRLTENRIRVILTLPSTPLTPLHLQRATGTLLIRFLAGPGWACFRGFTERERMKGEALGEGHWCRYNARILDALNLPAYAAHRLEAFEQTGRRVPLETLAQGLLKQSRRRDAQ
jgi:hypothetical protein